MNFKIVKTIIYNLHNTTKNCLDTFNNSDSNSIS